MGRMAESEIDQRLMNLLSSLPKYHLEVNDKGSDLSAASRTLVKDLLKEFRADDGMVYFLFEKVSA